MVARRPPSSRPFITAAAVTLLLFVGLAAAADALRPQAMVLRLSDVPRGYELGDDSGCGVMSVENAPPRLTQIVVAHRPQACLSQLEHLRRGRYVESLAFVFATEAGAAEMYADRRELLAHELSITRFTERKQTGVGDEARLFVTSDAPALGRSRPGAAVLWRRGAVLAAVMFAGPGRRTSKRVARRLARVQDRRMRRVIG